MAYLLTRKGWQYICYSERGIDGEIEKRRTSLKTRDRKLAGEVLKDYNAAERLGILGLTARQKRSIPPLDVLFDEYLEFMKKNRDPRTCRDAVLYVDSFLRPEFGSLRPDQLTDKHVEDFVGKLRNWTVIDENTGEPVPAPYHPNTINKRLKCLKTILKRAARPGGQIDKVPVDIKLLPVPKSLPKYITPDQFDAWWPCITRPLNRWRAVLELCTGIPDSELARLRWDKNYDEFLGVIKYRRNKTTTDIVVILNAWAREAIEELKKLRRGPYLFHGILEARRAYEVASAKSGVKVTPHMLRHSFATWALSEGEALAKIGAILGHADLSTTQRYAWVIPQFLAQTANAIDRLRPPSTRRETQETASCAITVQPPETAKGRS